MIRERCMVGLLRLAPTAEIVRGTGNETGAGRAAVAHIGQAHVHRGRFRVAAALAAREHLLEDVGQELVGRRVLTTGQQGTRGDLVESAVSS